MTPSELTVTIRIADREAFTHLLEGLIEIRSEGCACCNVDRKLDAILDRFAAEFSDISKDDA